jgi:hypothetical protein
VIEFKVHGLEELDRVKYRYRRGDAYVRQVLRQAMTLIVRYWRMAVWGRTPKRTGRLARGIREKVRVRGHTVVGILDSEAPYTMFVENDTRPHVIRPRRARALRFLVGDRVVFARRVRHPGTKGRHMFREGGKETRPRAVQLLRGALQQVELYLAGKKGGR